METELEIEMETLFWNVHRKKEKKKKLKFKKRREGEREKRNRAESGFNVYGVFLVSIGSIRRVYPVRPITGTRSIVP